MDYDNEVTNDELPEIDLQWFADDDDDNGDDNEGGHSSEAAEEQAEATSEDDDWDPDDWSGAFEFANDEPQVGDDDPNWSDTYTDYYGNEIVAGEGYTDTEGNWHDYTDDEKSTDDYGWEFKDPNSVGYEGYTDKNGQWHDSISVHNLGKAAEDAKSAISGWWESTSDKINRAFGGSREGLTSADFERVEEAEKARAVYENKAKEVQTAIDNLKSSKTFDPEKDAAKLAELEAERDGYSNKASSISRDFNSTDTGSRLGNIWGNIKEDLGDAGTRINQFFGGSDQYGLGAKGQINDRNMDGKTSIPERLANMGRDTLNWAKDKAINGVIQLGATAIPGGPLVAAIAGPSVKAGINKGIEALTQYGKTHPLTANDKEAIEQQREWDLAHQSDSEDTPVSDRAIQDKTPSVSTAAQVTQSPKWADWNTKTLGAMASNGHQYGWNKTNDVMGHSTMALSDAHFKDFMLATMVDNPTMQAVVKSKLMMAYFS